MHKALRFHGLPLLGYTLITLIVFSSLLPAFGQTIPGGGDALFFLWRLWYTKHALLDLHNNPFLTNLIFYPLQNVQVISETIYNEIIAMPLLVATTSTVQYNLLVLMSFVLSGYGMYLLTIYVTKRQAIAFVSGLFFAFCSYRLMRAIGHLSLVSTQWTPFLLLTALLAWQRPNVSTGLRLGFFAALTVFATPYHIGLVFLPAGLVLAPYLLLAQRHRLRERAVWMMATAAVVVFLLAIAPLLMHYATLSKATYTVASEMATGARAESADLLSWLLPPAHNPIWGRWTEAAYRNFASPNQAETTIFVGIIPLILAALSVARRKRLPRGAGYWQALALVTVLLSFGPVLHWRGHELFGPMPYAWFMELPGFYLFRIPSRFAITAALPIYLLAAMVFAEISADWTVRRTKWVLVPGAALITINMLTHFPYPTSNTTVPPYVERIAATPGKGAVLSLPAGEFFFPDNAYGFMGEIEWAMYFQTGHGKPLISGMMTRRPANLFVPEQTLPFVRRFFYNDPLLRFVQFPSTQILPLNQWPDDILFGDEVLQSEGIAHAVVECSRPSYDQCPKVLTLLTLALGIPLEAEDGSYGFGVGTPHMRELPDFLATAAIVGTEDAGAWTPVADGRSLAVSDSTLITITTPLDGIWRLTGEWRGEALSTATLIVDGARPPWRFVDAAPHDPWSQWPPRRYFEATMPLTAGLHSLQVTAASVQGATAPAAAVLALANLNVRLRKASAPSGAAALATFHEKNGRAWQLAAATLLPISSEYGAAPASHWLVTRWEGDGIAALASNQPGNLPRLGVELRSANGQQLQVHSSLGSRAVWDAADTSALVAVELPAAAFAQGTPQILLWLEGNVGDDKLAMDPQHADALNNVLTLSEQLVTTPVRVNDAPANTALRTRFASEADGRAYALIDAYLTQSAPDAPYQLISVWDRVADGGAPTPRAQTEPVQIFVHAEGNGDSSTTIAAKALGALNFSALGGTRIYDVLKLELPPAGSEGIKLRMGLWNPLTGERYVAIGDSRIDKESRLKLGSVKDILRAQPALTP